LQIAIFTDGMYPFMIGGMQKHSYYLCKYLAQNGFQLHVFHPKEAIEKSAILPEQVFTKEEFQFINLIPVPFPAYPKFPGHYILESFIYAKNIFQKFISNLNFQIDFLYIQGLTGWVYLSNHRYSDVPCCINFHGLEMFQHSIGLKSRLQQLLFKPWVIQHIRRADYVQSLGGNLTNLLLSLNVPLEKIWKLGIGIEASWLAPKKEIQNNRIRKFTFIGRYEPRKGIQLLHEVIQKIANKHTFTVEFIGPINPKNQLNLSNITYHGLLTTETAIQDVLDTTDVLVCPSYAEGMPTVILEAMARNCAILATDVGAVNELVSFENGWLISPGNIHSLQKAMVEAICMSDEELILKKQESFNLVEKKFMWDEVAIKLINFIKKVIYVNPDF